MIGGCSNRPMSPGRLAAGAYSGCADAASQSAAGTPRHASAAGRLFAPVGWTRSGPLSTGACDPADQHFRLIGMSRKGHQRPLPARRYPDDPRQALVEAMHRPTLYPASSSWRANITSSSSRITLGPASRNTSIINSEPGLARAADASEAEMLAGAFTASQRGLMTAERVVSNIVRPARVAPSCTECTRPRTGRSRSGSRTTLGSSWATAICPIRTE